MDKHALNKFIEHTDIVFSYTKLLILKTSTSERESESERRGDCVCLCLCVCLTCGSESACLVCVNEFEANIWLSH